MNLTFEQMLVLLGAFVGLQAVFIAVILMFLRNALMHDRAKCYQNNHIHGLTEYSIKSISEVLIELSSTLELHAGLIRKNIKMMSKDDELPYVSSVNFSNSQRIIKAMQELMISSADEIRRRSAIQQLSNTSLGNTKSLICLKEMAAYYPDDNDIKRGIAELEVRLSNKP
jgi:hypothetical protein